MQRIRLASILLAAAGILSGARFGIEHVGKLVRVQCGETHIAANETSIILQLPDGVRYTLPPDYRAFELAEPGSCRLRSSGEVVVNPDNVAAWVITGVPDNELSVG